MKCAGQRWPRQNEEKAVIKKDIMDKASISHILFVDFPHLIIDSIGKS